MHRTEGVSQSIHQSFRFCFSADGCSVERGTCRPACGDAVSSDSQWRRAAIRRGGTSWTRSWIWRGAGYSRARCDLGPRGTAFCPPSHPRQTAQPWVFLFLFQVSPRAAASMSPCDAMYPAPRLLLCCARGGDAAQPRSRPTARERSWSPLGGINGVCIGRMDVASTTENDTAARWLRVCIPPLKFCILD